ncbi:cytochrome-c oxidase, cbb3-type subunit III [Thioalkalivibrio sulfidiphilus]|uniref:cytochrome-c oxidase, cbb3-type subunit III n=1 Tax=Thioalkalivibrio sulfidiphilus TaxID=1033854 RepID=UPI00037D2E62|nr:cytochrome-c oxidase, cbb3-type subunit III [Thioalkalivibrio sulfidiphilus]
MSKPTEKKGAVQTTGHAWDGDLQEYNNPLPRWWLWGFYATVVFAVVYWLMYPAWPVGNTFTKGFNTITFEVDGEERTTHWNTRALLVRDMQSSPSAVRQREFLEQIAAASYEEILTDADKLAFVRSYAHGIYGDFCAACHQVGGAGIVGLYPNLANDDWLWGGTVERIEETLIQGRLGYMPSYRETLNADQMTDVAVYVLSIAGYEGGDADAIGRGDRIFHGAEGGCFQCHNVGGVGRTSQGAPNLTNNIWQIIDVPNAADHDARVELVKSVLRNGIQRQMPAFADRLSPIEIKVLTAYVHQLGGGQ